MAISARFKWLIYERTTGGWGRSCGFIPVARWDAPNHWNDRTDPPRRKNGPLVMETYTKQLSLAEARQRKRYLYCGGFDPIRIWFISSKRCAVLLAVLFFVAGVALGLIVSGS